jgi:hypothetical protein
LSSFASDRTHSRRAKPPPQPKEKPQDINAILDKISKSGIQSLTKAEHEALLKASQKGRREENDR